MEDTFVKIENGKIVEWGLSYQGIMNRCPGISFPKKGIAAKTLESLGYKKTVKTKSPNYNPDNHTLSEIQPKLGKDGRPYRQWSLAPIQRSAVAENKYVHPEVAVSTGKVFEVSETCLIKLTAHVTYMKNTNQTTCKWKSYTGEIFTVWREELVEALGKVISAFDEIVDTNIW